MGDKSNASEQDLEAVRKDLDELRNDFETLIKALKGDAEDELEDVAERIEATLRSEAGMAGAKADAVSQRLQQTGQNLKQSAEDNPFTTALVALCTGLITGVVISGRR
ncbi:MAG: hypothetical protein ACOCVI_03105 [Planctomycetota bacterium]